MAFALGSTTGNEHDPGIDGRAQRVLFNKNNTVDGQGAAAAEANYEIDSGAYFA
jgi:hypothetical protein